MDDLFECRVEVDPMHQQRKGRCVEERRACGERMEPIVRMPYALRDGHLAAPLYAEELQHHVASGTIPLQPNPAPEALRLLAKGLAEDRLNARPPRSHEYGCHHDGAYEAFVRSDGNIASLLLYPFQTETNEQLWFYQTHLIPSSVSMPCGWDVGMIKSRFDMYDQQDKSIHGDLVRLLSTCRHGYSIHVREGIKRLALSMAKVVDGQAAGLADENAMQGALPSYKTLARCYDLVARAVLSVMPAQDNLALWEDLEGMFVTPAGIHNLDGIVHRLFQSHRRYILSAMRRPMPPLSPHRSSVDVDEDTAWSNDQKEQVKQCLTVSQRLWDQCQSSLSPGGKTIVAADYIGLLCCAVGYFRRDGDADTQSECWSLAKSLFDVMFMAHSPIPSWSNFQDVDAWQCISLGCAVMQDSTYASFLLSHLDEGIWDDAANFVGIIEKTWATDLTLSWVLNLLHAKKEHAMAWELLNQWQRVADTPLSDVVLLPFLHGADLSGLDNVWHRLGPFGVTKHASLVTTYLKLACQRVQNVDEKEAEKYLAVVEDWWSHTDVWNSPCLDSYVMELWGVTLWLAGHVSLSQIDRWYRRFHERLGLLPDTTVLMAMMQALDRQSMDGDLVYRVLYGWMCQGYDVAVCVVKFAISCIRHPRRIGKLRRAYEGQHHLHSALNELPPGAGRRRAIGLSDTLTASPSLWSTNDALPCHPPRDPRFTLYPSPMLMRERRRRLTQASKRVRIIKEKTAQWQGRAERNIDRAGLGNYFHLTKQPSFTKL